MSAVMGDLGLTALRLGLFANGYTPLPITAPDYPQHPKVKCPGKQPFFKEWQTISRDTLTPAVVEGWTTGIAHHSNTGLLTGTLLALDIDVLNEGLSAQIQRMAGAMLGATSLLRVGRAPKVALLYRNEMPISKVATPELFLTDGTKLQVEALGSGQQIVGFGIHPDTGKSYVWPQSDPTQTPLADLPVVTEAVLRGFMAAAEAVLREAGGRTKKEREAAAAAPQPAYRNGSTGPAHVGTPGGSDFFRQVNTRALTNIGAWFPALLPKARQEPGTGAWRVSSADLGRDLDEDISVHASGARDFGTEEPCTPIDLVMTWGGAPNAKDAAFYLCERLRIAPADCGWTHGRALAGAATAKHPAAPGGGQAEVAEPDTAAEARAPELEADPAAEQVSATPEARAQEIDRLSLLPPADYTAERKAAAKKLGLGVGDLNRLVKDARTKQRNAAAAHERARSGPEVGSVRWPHGFNMCADGLYAEADGGGLPTWLSGPFEVLGEARDTRGEGWALWLAWKDSDGRAHSWPMPRRLLMVEPGKLEADLASKGLSLAVALNARTSLRAALGGVKAGNRVTLTSLPGWHAPGAGDAAYVLPNGETIGTAREQLVLEAQADNADHAMAQAGTLKEWQDAVAALMVGNPIPSFMIAAALAGPLLEPLGEASGGFHFYGRSKTGKTLALRTAISVWGTPRKNGLLRDWRSTAGGLEAAAEECTDGLLPLDEIHQADPRDVVGGIYALANESGKARLRRDATAQRRRTWRNIVISTGEIDIAAVVAKAGQTLPAGADVRLPSISIDDADMWPNLHGAASAVELMARLQVTLPHHYGSAIRPFLERLATERNNGHGELDQAAADMRERFAKRLPVGADPQVRDVARRCALVALAGETASKWGVLPWREGEAERAARVVFDLWLGRRGGVGSNEESQHVRAVRTFLLEHGASRFVALAWDGSAGKWIEKHPDRPVISRAGWRRENGIEESDEEAIAALERESARKAAYRAEHGPGSEPPSEVVTDEYLVAADAWRELCVRSRVDPTETAKTLVAAGFLMPGTDGRPTKQVRVPVVGNTRAYVVTAAIFGGRSSAGAGYGDD